MTQFRQPFTWRIIGASLGALFHFCTVVLPLVVTGGKGEGQAGIVFIFDLPLVLFLQIFPQGEKILYGTPFNYIAFFSFFGTALYVAVGWVVGYFIEYRHPPIAGIKIDLKK